MKAPRPYKAKSPANVPSQSAPKHMKLDGHLKIQNPKTFQWLSSTGTDFESSTDSGYLALTLNPRLCTASARPPVWPRRRRGT